MGKRKEAALKEKRRFSNKQLAILSIISISIIVLGSVLSFLLLQTPIKFYLNAAIIDQLGEELPNSQFVDNATDILMDAGFNVTYHKSKNLDVNFFKELAKYNYGMIILRVHSALREDSSTVDLFTAELFDEHAHVQDLNNHLLVMGILNYSRSPQKYFALTSKFIENLEGCFPKSVVIAMGCWGLKPECKQMAEAFVTRGATVYIGWTNMVDLDHTDDETIKLLRMLLEENETIHEAVGRTSPDWRYYSEMRYYPESAGSLTISSLIVEAKASLNLQSAITSFKPLSVVCITNFIPLKIRKKFRYNVC
jgi:hypothetical protein